jgi:hypothetical protein
MEKEYKLTTKSGEVIRKVKAYSKTLAISFFSKMKNLRAKHLLKIYKVI